MKPGLELDALIAEQIMQFPRASIKGIGTTWSRRNDKDGFYLKPYSTDIAAAWEVIEKLKSRDSIVSIYISNDTDDDSVEVDIYDKEKNIKLGRGKHESISAIGKTAPHAICLAALKDMGIEV